MTLRTADSVYFANPETLLHSTPPDITNEQFLEMVVILEYKCVVAVLIPSTQKYNLGFLFSNLRPWQSLSLCQLKRTTLSEV